MNILSIQSWVAYGHVGNAAATFPLQTLGAEVWAAHTVQLSNHPGYGDFTGEFFPAEKVAALIDGIERRGALAQCDAVLSGYLGDAAMADVIADAVARTRTQSPEMLYGCDPVIGDDGPGAYVRPGVEEAIRERLLPLADIATPNRFELERLTGIGGNTLAEAKRAVTALQARMHGPRTVLVTSLTTEDTPDDSIDLLAGEGGSFHRLRTPRLPISVNGAGDAIAALFLFHRRRTGSAAAALEAAGSAINGLLRLTEAAGTRELALIAARDEFLTPSRRFLAEPC